MLGGQGITPHQHMLGVAADIPGWCVPSNVTLGRRSLIVVLDSDIPPDADQGYSILSVAYLCVERIFTDWYDALFRQSQRKLSTLLRGLQRWLVASYFHNIRLLMVFLGLLYYLYLFGAPFPACFSLMNAELHCVS